MGRVHVSGSLVVARVRGLCTMLVIESGALADCQSWRIQSKTRELPLAIAMLTLCRNSDFFLRACQPEPPASGPLLLTRLLEVRLDDSRVELEANAAKLVKGNRDEFQRSAGSSTRRAHRTCVLCLFASAFNGRGSERGGGLVFNT